ncbi:MAG: polysaccharide deacetylase family protein [Candidatus Omnitrophota bacterium]
MVNTFDKLKILYRLGFDKKQPKVFSFHDCLPDVFSRYVELLNYKRYRILSAGELFEKLEKGDIFDKEVILTFDDGRRNCWTVIFPLLKKYKIKAVFFIIPSKIIDTDQYFPNLEDFWQGKVSWENLYLSHRLAPYLTWAELKKMCSSGLVEIFSHSLKHEVVSVSSRVIDFQHPGVYEIPVYFDEWMQANKPDLDSLWGEPVFEHSWSCLASNAYVPDEKMNRLMNEFVRVNGGFLFFRKKRWRKKLFDYYHQHKNLFSSGYFHKIENGEIMKESIEVSKENIEDKLGCTCSAFSLPLYQGDSHAMDLIASAGYMAVFSGFMERQFENKSLYFINRIPGFWIKFLAYL